MGNKCREPSILLAHSHAHAHSAVTVTFASFSFAALAGVVVALTSFAAVSHIHATSPVHAAPATVHTHAALQDTVDGARHESVSINIILDGALEVKTTVGLGRRHGKQQGQEEENKRSKLHGDFSC